MTRNITRRSFAALTGSAALAGLSGLAQTGPTILSLYVSSWTSGANGAGADGGIHHLLLNPQTGALTLSGSFARELNAGYICLSPSGGFLYATDERKDFEGRLGAGGGVHAFRIDPKTGSLSPLKAVPSMGAFPAFISMDRSGTLLAVANHGSYDTIARIVSPHHPEIENLYDDASVSLFAASASGHVDPAADVAVLQRGHAIGWEKETGLDAVFQASPHAHSVNFDPSNRFTLTCDKGADRIYVHRLQKIPPRLRNASIHAASPGCAPRHSAFHPRLPFVFVVNELVPTVTSYALDLSSGRLTEIGSAPTVLDRAAYTGQKRNLPADIRVHPNGRFVYASTRGADTITIFHLEEATGHLSVVDTVPCGGKTPRAFSLDPTGTFLLCGGQDSDEIIVFGVNPDTGLLHELSRSGVPRPVCIKFAPARLALAMPRSQA